MKLDDFLCIQNIFLIAESSKWEILDSNQWPYACKASALPLRQSPIEYNITEIFGFVKCLSGFPDKRWATSDSNRDYIASKATLSTVGVVAQWEMWATIPHGLKPKVFETFAATNYANLPMVPDGTAPSS